MTNFFKSFTFRLLVLWLLLVQLRCPRPDFNYDVHLKPVYADSVRIHRVTVEPPRILVHTAKIYYKDSIIYIIEKNQGIHVIDNHLPSAPTPIRFIKMEGCEDIAIKDNTLYADNYTDLVALDITNPHQPVMVSRLRGIYPAAVDGKPTRYFKAKYENENILYECIDSTKGKVVSWQQTQLDTSKCYKRL